MNHTVVPVVPSFPRPSELGRTKGISAMTGTASGKFSRPSELGTVGSTLTV